MNSKAIAIIAAVLALLYFKGKSVQAGGLPAGKPIVPAYSTPGTNYWWNPLPPTWPQYEPYVPDQGTGYVPPYVPPAGYYDEGSGQFYPSGSALPSDAMSGPGGYAYVPGGAF